MGSRRLRPMTVSDLDTLPPPCASCAFWETGPADLAAPAEQADRKGAKVEQATEVMQRWGYCGVVAVQDNETIGYLSMAPSGYVRRLTAFGGTPVSPDVAVLTAVQVVEEWRGKGIGRQLVQSAAGLLTRRDIRAIEAVGTHHDGPSCMMPTGWLEAVGFAVVRPHPVTPRLRMDLQNAIGWRADLGAAWNRLTELVSPAASPEPASYVGREEA